MDNDKGKMSNEERARAIAQRKMGFFTHLAVYIVVISFLIVLNIFTSNGKEGDKSYWWFFPAGGWGIGLFFHFLATFVGGGALEDRMAQKELERLNKNSGE